VLLLSFTICGFNGSHSFSFPQVCLHILVLLSTLILLNPCHCLLIIAVAMPEMTRTWVIPASASHSELKFVIREPALTGDNLGLKTWGTAFAISKKIGQIGLNHFSHLWTGVNDTFTTSCGRSFTRPNMRVLEYVLLIPPIH
jgi:hypothetical protein